MSPLKVALAVLLPEGAQDGKHPKQLGPRTVTPPGHQHVMEYDPPQRASIVERLAARARAEHHHRYDGL